MFSLAVYDEDIAFESVSFQTCRKEDCEATVQAILTSSFGSLPIKYLRSQSRWCYTLGEKNLFLVFLLKICLQRKKST